MFTPVTKQSSKHGQFIFTDSRYTSCERRFGLAHKQRGHMSHMSSKQETISSRLKAANSRSRRWKRPWSPCMLTRRPVQMHDSQSPPHVLWRTKALTLSGSGAAGIGCGANSAWSRTQRRQPSKHETSFLPRAASWRWLRSTGQRIPLTRCPVHNSQSLLSASCPVTDWGADAVRFRNRCGDLQTWTLVRKSTQLVTIHG